MKSVGTRTKTKNYTMVSEQDDIRLVNKIVFEGKHVDNCQ